jgi:fatty-acyl-CoA synthase
MAKDIGFDGIELRGLGGEISAFKAKPFLPNEILQTKTKLKALQMEISCISSSCCVQNEYHIQKTMTEGLSSIDLASQLGTRFVRILGDIEPFETSPVDENAAVRALKGLSDYAAPKNITLLVETNGVYASSPRLKALMEKVNRTNVAVLWDVHHPARYKGETPAETYQLLEPWIRYVHVKDSIMVDDHVQYKMMGEGDIPIKEALDILFKDNFEGFVSLEWVKRWSKDIEDAAIVFPHFVNYMQQYQTRTGAKDAHTLKERTMRPYDKDILVNITLADLVDKMALEYPLQEAFVFPQFNLRYTYLSFKEEAERIACGLTAIGIKKGDHVAIWATNYPEWMFTLFACAKIGAILVTVNTSYKIHEAEYLLRQSDTSTLVMIDGFKDSNYIEIIHEICPELAGSKPGELKSKRLPCLKNVIAIASPIKGAYHWSELKKLGESVDRNELAMIQKGMNEHETINMQYTSGTTGFPKGVMLTHYNIINNGKNIGDCMDFSTKDRLLICVPLFHCFGLVLGTMASFSHATTMVVVDYFQPLKVLNVLQKEKCTAMHGVPTMFIACLEHPDFNTFNLSHIRTGIMAGSPCPIKVMQDVVDKMHMSEITIVYGQTEASPGCTQTRTDDSLEKRVSTVGRELPGVECKIVDPQTYAELKPGQIGEFVARGYNIMKGYYNMPEATAAVIDKDGWLHTGDLATKDEDGYYKITGRLKDMIIRGGENIYPMEIEEFLYSHPDIKDVQVVGVPDKTYGEEVFAAIVLKEGAKATEDAIRDYVRSHMARHKVPKYIKFVDSFPMTASGKIQKFKIRDAAVEEYNLQMDQAIETA